MAGKTFVWTVPRDVWELLNHMTNQYNNGLISEVELIDKMRTYGWPADATPGDHIHIRIPDRTVALVPGRRGVLPGLPS